MLGRAQWAWAVVIGVGVAAGCRSPVALYCDTNRDCEAYPERPYCDRAGELPGSDGHANTCVPAPGDTSDAGAGVLADAAVGYDAAPRPPDQMQFAVAYVSDFQFGGSSDQFSTGSILRIINTGEHPLDLSLAEFGPVILDDPRIVFGLVWNDELETLLEPGLSGGNLNPEARHLILDQQLVPEPAQETATSYVTIEILTPEPGFWLMFHAEVSLTIGNARVNLPFDAIVSGTGAVSMTDARRVSSIPVPGS